MWTASFGVGRQRVIGDEEDEVSEERWPEAAACPRGDHRQQLRSGHRGEPRGDWACQGKLSEVSESALHEGCTQRGPDEALDDLGVLGLQGTKAGVGLSVLEQKFDLPSKPVQLSDGFGAEVLGDVGEEPCPRLLLST